MKYRIYIDEVGNHDLKSSNDPNHRFLSLSGVILNLDYVKNQLHPEMESIKHEFFDSHPDEPIIFHRKELVNGKPPFEALRDEERRKHFDRRLLFALSKWNYRVITVCLDKKNHWETYSVWHYDPYHYCLAMILERYVFFLESQQDFGDVMAESRGGKEDKRLKSSFSRVWENGTDFMDASRFQKVLTSKQLKVKNKMNNIAGLQLADLIAHPSRNEILRENRHLTRNMGLFAEQVITILQEKYYKKAGKIRGIGKKFI